MEKLIAVRLDESTAEKLDTIVEVTGWNQSEVIRRLIDAAKVTPPSLSVRIIAKKDEALAVA